MKRLISVFMLVCLLASFCTISASAATERQVSNFDELKTALTNAADGDTISFKNDINAGSNIVWVGWKSATEGWNENLTNITINGNGFTLNSTAGRAINIAVQGKVTISNLNITTTGERAINVITKPVELVIDNTDTNIIEAGNYAINVAGSGSGSKITINNGTYNGLNTLNIGGTATVVANNAIFNTNDTSSDYEYGTLSINPVAKGTSVTFNGGALNYTSTDEYGVHVNNNYGGAVSFNGTTTTFNGTSVSPIVVNKEAIINYGDYFAGYRTLADAIAQAKEGETVVVVRDLDLGRQILDVDKNIIIDANGYKIDNAAFNVGPNATRFDITNPYSEAQKTQLLSGKLPPLPSRVPSTGDDSNMMLWGVLLAGFAVVAVLSRKKRSA